MAKNIHDLAKEAFDNGNYQLAVNLFKRALQSGYVNYSVLHGDHESDNLNTIFLIDSYFGYGDSLARCGHIKESFRVYAFICDRLGYTVSVDKLKHLTCGLIESVSPVVATFTVPQNSSSSSSSMTSAPASSPASLPAPTKYTSNACNDTINEIHKQHYLSVSQVNPYNSEFEMNVATEVNSKMDFINSNSNSNLKKSSNVISNSDRTVLLDKCINKDINECDPLQCPLCDDILMWPVTMNCGHSYCRQCVYNQTQCYVCGKKFIQYGYGLKQDVLISRLIEKWWQPLIHAQFLNAEAELYLQQNALDEALKSCNASLQKHPTNLKGLILRSEVLCRLNHLQSSLADAENAIKCCPNSYKAYQVHAIALTKLGHIEDAFIAYCLSLAFSKDPSNVPSSVRLELAKIIQRLLTPVKLPRNTAMLSVEPYRLNEFLLQRRALRHFSIYRKKRHHPDDVDDDDDDDDETLFKQNYMTFDSDSEYYHNSNNSKNDEENLHQNHNNDLYAYKQSHRLMKTLKKYRRKRYQSEHLTGLKEFALLDHLANKVTNSVSNTIVIPNVNHTRTICDLLDRIKLEISKVKKLKNKTNFLNVNSALVEVSDFDCVLCYRTLWKPVATPCGHTYCMVCLDRCLDYSTCCPLCKTSLIDDSPVPLNTIPSRVCSAQISTNNSTTSNPVSFSASIKCVTRFIETAMQRFIPTAYKKRQLQEIEKEPSIPVFICTTAYPNVPCPLYVYEPRYRLMIRRAIESGQRQFGIVQSLSNGGYSDYGTVLDIRDCILLGNGCSILSTVGCKRFKVIKRNEKDGYDTAKVEYICDEPINPDRLTTIKLLNETVFRKASDWYNSLPRHILNEINKSFGPMPFTEDDVDYKMDGPAWAWYIIALLPLNQNLKVEILATMDLEKRLRAIDKTLEYVAAQLRRSVCVVACDGLQTCQAVDCCLRASTSATRLSDHAPSPEDNQNEITEFLL